MWNSTHDRALSVRGTLVKRRPERSVEVASRSSYRLAGIHRKGRYSSSGRVFSADRSEAETVALMTVYETVMVVLGVIGLLISLGSLLIALLNFLDEREQHK